MLRGGPQTGTSRVFAPICSRKTSNDSGIATRRSKAVVDADCQAGNRLAVTPFFFLNGHAISGAVGLEQFIQIIDAVLKEWAPPASDKASAK
jgi:predicted DsbA family dithiol-disulfide isomerase